MTRGEVFIKRGKYKHGHCSSISNSAWCNLNNKGDIPKLHDLCHNPKCECQKQINFTPRQFQLEEAGFKCTIKKILMGLKKCGIISVNLD